MKSIGISSMRYIYRLFCPMKAMTVFPGAVFNFIERKAQNRLMAKGGNASPRKTGKDSL